MYKIPVPKLHSTFLQRRKEDNSIKGTEISKLKNVNIGRMFYIQKNLGNRNFNNFLSSELRLEKFENTSETEGNWYSHDFEREHFCIDEPNTQNPTRRQFTNAERRLISFSLLNAQSVASRAFRNLGRRDRYYLRMGERAFGRSVNFDLLDRNVSRIRAALNNLRIDQNIFAATCDDTDCNANNRNFLAYTSADLSGVVLCPFFFIQRARTMVVTFIHEAGHMANIDVNWSPGNERYCRQDDVMECTNICPLSGENLLENVDAWARFIYCVSVSG